ncbi:helix-turn-helix domain-containing protein [Pedobacter sp. HX-22-1]|uniref:Helix-turn-helix domain-containing protein n=2 Tax=Pedobacter puniceum TaxID=2666136 RepID=A0A7K0FS12_9SPHI|nr:helix-turn-helix domain-containing protein [Pedobacter puniceum]
MLSALYIWACFQGLFFGISILIMKFTRANFFLSLFYVLTSVYIGNQYLLRFADFLDTHPEFVFLSDYIDISLGPIVYIYMLLILNRRYPKHLWLYFLPTILVILFTSYFLVFKWLPFSYNLYIGTAYHDIVLLAVVISYTVYAILYIRKVKAYQLKEFNKKEVVDWLKLLFIIFFLKMITAYFILIKNQFLPSFRTQLNPILEMVLVITDSIILLLAGIYALKEPQLLQMDKIELFNITISKKNKLKLSEEEILLYKSNLNKAIDIDKIYKQWDLNEKGLAKALNVQPYILSIFLNEHLGQTFNEFINYKRIEEAKKLLLNPKTMNDKMYTIALESGYNSESVFYTNFKKFTGFTPRQFQKSQLN